jgi:ligand-binding sensor protein
VKYNDNPKYVSFTETFLDVIMPEVKTYCDFIPNVYYITATNIEGSLIPLVISKKDEGRKNLIISADMFDTQYDLLNNFEMHIIHRCNGFARIAWNVPGYMEIQTRRSNDYIKDVCDVFEKNYYFYVGLLSMLGSRIRSIDGINGFGPYTLKKSIMDGINSKKINENSSNPEMIASIFNDDDLKDEFINNFLCTSYMHMYNNMATSDELNITNQMIDRSDITTLQALNRTRFYNHPIKLEWLI